MPLRLQIKLIASIHLLKRLL